MAKVIWKETVRGDLARNTIRVRSPNRMLTAKQVVKEVVDSLPDDCTLDDISYRLYLRRKLERSTKAIEEGRVHSYEEGKEIVQSWFTSSGPTQH